MILVRSRRIVGEDAVDPAGDEVTQPVGVVERPQHHAIQLGRVARVEERGELAGEVTPGVRFSV